MLNNELNIIHKSDEQCFELELEQCRAFVKYEIYDQSLDIRTTLVPPQLGGRGIAGHLVKAAYDYAQSQNLKCLATCSYALTWLKRHPEYNGQASSDFVEGSCAIAKHKA